MTMAPLSTFYVLSFQGEPHLAWQIGSDDSGTCLAWLLNHYHALIDCKQEVATAELVHFDTDQIETEYGTIANDDGTPVTERKLFYALSRIFGNEKLVAMINHACTAHLDECTGDCSGAQWGEHSKRCIAGFQLSCIWTAIYKTDVIATTFQFREPEVPKIDQDETLTGVINDILRCYCPERFEIYSFVLIEFACYMGIVEIGLILSDFRAGESIQKLWNRIWSSVPDHPFRLSASRSLNLMIAHHSPSQDELIEIVIDRVAQTCDCGYSSWCESEYHDYDMAHQIVDYLIDPDRITELFVRLCIEETGDQFTNMMLETHTIDVCAQDYLILTASWFSDAVINLLHQRGIYCYRHEETSGVFHRLRFFITPELLPETHFAGYAIYRIQNEYMYTTNIYLSRSRLRFVPGHVVDGQLRECTGEKAKLMMPPGQKSDSSRETSMAVQKQSRSLEAPRIPTEDRTITVRKVKMIPGKTISSREYEIEVPGWLDAYVNLKMSNLKKSARSAR